MNKFKVLILADGSEGPVSQLADLHQFNSIGMLTVTRHPTISKCTAATFDLILIEAGRDTLATAIETSRSIRSETQAPILLVSSVADEEDAIAAYHAGVDNYIIKPLSVELLYAKVRAVLRWTAPALCALLLPLNQVLNPI